MLGRLSSAVSQGLKVRHTYFEGGVRSSTLRLAIMHRQLNLPNIVFRNNIIKFGPELGLNLGLISDSFNASKGGQTSPQPCIISP